MEPSSRLAISPTSLPIGFLGYGFLPVHHMGGGRDGPCQTREHSHARSTISGNCSCSMFWRHCARGRRVALHLRGQPWCGPRRQGHASARLQRIVDGVAAKGLATHEVADELESSPFGVSWNGQQHYTSLTPKRFCRVAQVVRFALARRAEPGLAWELLVGHRTFCGLVVRDVLCVLHLIYMLFRKHHCDRVLFFCPGRRSPISAWP